MKNFAGILVSLVMLSSAAGVANAQNRDREPGWEAYGALLYQFESNLKFDGGTTVDLEDDLGLALGFGYRFNGHLELQFDFDWQSVGYEADLRVGTTPVTIANVRTDYESLSLKASLIWNLVEGPFTPYFGAGGGWSFIDTNIAAGRPQTGCYWDPWWGYICNTYQDTYSSEEFVYQGIAGLRFDFDSGVSMRVQYQRQFLDIGVKDNAGVDQVMLAVVRRF